MTWKPRWLLRTAPVLIVLASPWHAYGFDYKIHPGSLCQPSRGGDAVHFSRGPGFIQNTNPLAALPVTCPILRDRVPRASPPNADERTRLDVGVHFDTGAAKSRITCTFFAEDHNGGTVFQFSQSIDPPQKSMFWDVPPDKTATDGTYSIVCELPVLAFLLRYIIGEEDKTDHPN